MGCISTKLIFPKPEVSYDASDPNLIWIPNKNNLVPCMFVKYPSETDKIVLFFHGNAEDLGNSAYFLEPVSRMWRVCPVLI